MTGKDHCPLCKQIRENNRESTADGLTFFDSCDGPVNEAWARALKRVTWKQLNQARLEISRADEATVELWAGEALALITRHVEMDRYALQFVAWRRVRSGYFLGQDYGDISRNIVAEATA